MIKSLKSLLAIFVAILVTTGSFAQKQYKYQSVPGDPMNARIYTLDNGLKVYLTVYKDEPRIQTFVAVAAGSKNDPADAKGLAHYFEHMMFKGTPSFGTNDWSKEKPLIASIDSTFEVYRKISDDNDKKQVYHIIDSLSFEASKYAIPNEYDKLMSIIGASGTNAYTSLEQTVFIEDIPSNQLENWAKIESDRFMNPVLRLFHTELETIYEEYNMGKANDDQKMYHTLLETLFQKHTYGVPTIGYPEDLKNPSMKRIREFHSQYYVPGNIAICMSGDLDFDKTIALIDKYFGAFPSKPVPPFTFEKEEPITSPIVKEVMGNDAERIALAFRFGGAASKDADMITMIDMIMNNSAAGLMDLNLLQKQTVLEAYSYCMINKDYSAQIFAGKPKEGQTLEQLKDLLLEQLDKLKKGEFDDWLIPAIINDMKLRKMKSLEKNSSRARQFVESFVLGVDWKDYINEIHDLEKITKEDVVKFANEHFKDNNYVVVYKRVGKDESIKKIKKQKITPVKVNREMQSDFLKGIEDAKIDEIEPVFLDFDKDIQKLKIKSDIEVLYTPNIENKTFELYYVYEMGSNHDKLLPLAIDYLEYLGTSKFSPEDVKKEFYKLGTSFSVFNSDDQVYVSLSGLSENIDKSLELFESLLSDPQPNPEALTNMVSDALKERADNKMNPQAILGYLFAYGMYGEINPGTYVLSEKELKALKPEELLPKIKELNSYKHTILYYGSHSSDEVIAALNKYHNAPATLKDLPAEKDFPMLPTDENKVYFAQYDQKQLQIIMVTRGDQGFDKTRKPIIQLFNEYFGGGMNSIVFQELREARGLAYTAFSGYFEPQKLNKRYYGLSFIMAQPDKMKDAMDGFFGLMNDMPESEKAFGLGKKVILQRLRTERTTKKSKLFAYLGAKKLGLDYDIRKDIYAAVPNLTIADVKIFADKYIKNKKQTICIIGNKDDVDMKLLKEYGKIKMVDLKTIFGY
ncbi:MAG: insulinase family protein [Bacteroidetes bacterium]|nr:insulinase family protein [Bacteroidota bacterium]MBU1720508.1 insulinase family protein [Bacteroidota bacterium]